MDLRRKLQRKRGRWETTRRRKVLRRNPTDSDGFSDGHYPSAIPSETDAGFRKLFLKKFPLFPTECPVGNSVGNRGKYLKKIRKNFCFQFEMQKGKKEIIFLKIFKIEKGKVVLLIYLYTFVKSNVRI